MTNSTISDAVLWLNTIGLVLGAIGALVLAAFSRVFITIEPDGSQHWGPPKGMPIEQWMANNRRLRTMQQYLIPSAYGLIVIGFCTQLAALWLGRAC